MDFLSLKDSFFDISSGGGGGYVQHLRDLGDGVEGYVLNLIWHRFIVSL